MLLIGSIPCKVMHASSLPNIHKKSAPFSSIAANNAAAPQITPTQAAILPRIASKYLFRPAQSSTKSLIMTTKGTQTDFPPLPPSSGNIKDLQRPQPRPTVVIPVAPVHPEEIPCIKKSKSTADATLQRLLQEEPNLAELHKLRQKMFQKSSSLHAECTMQSFLANTGRNLDNSKRRIARIEEQSKLMGDEYETLTNTMLSSDAGILKYLSYSELRNNAMDAQNILLLDRNERFAKQNDELKKENAKQSRTIQALQSQLSDFKIGLRHVPQQLPLIIERRQEQMPRLIAQESKSQE